GQARGYFCRKGWEAVACRACRDARVWTSASRSGASNAEIRAARDPAGVPADRARRTLASPHGAFRLRAVSVQTNLALAAAAAMLKPAPPEILPAFLPTALVGPSLRHMERSGYEPFQFKQISPWRRQWLLWRAARDPSRIFNA